MARNQDFTKWEGIKSQVKNFYKYIKIGKRGDQISATQTYHRRGLGVEPPAPGGYGGLEAKLLGNFLEKNSHFNVIWITFRTFLEPLEKTKFLRFESQ